MPVRNEGQEFQGSWGAGGWKQCLGFPDQVSSSPNSLKKRPGPRKTKKQWQGAFATGLLDRENEPLGKGRRLRGGVKDVERFPHFVQAPEAETNKVGQSPVSTWAEPTAVSGAFALSSPGFGPGLSAAADLDLSARPRRSARQVARQPSRLAAYRHWRLKSCETRLLTMGHCLEGGVDVGTTGPRDLVHILLGVECHKAVHRDSTFNCTFLRTR
ncbi:hypothetical protein VTK26DRAFT_5805 [Humicola hyalothermophila]